MSSVLLLCSFVLVRSSLNKVLSDERLGAKLRVTEIYIIYTQLCGGRKTRVHYVCLVLIVRVGR